MDVSDDGLASLQAWSRALRAGVPVRWLPSRLPTGWLVEELQPLVAASEDAAVCAPGSLHPEVTIVLPTHRHTPFACAALAQQSIPVHIWVIENGGAIAVPPGVVCKKMPWQGHGATRRAVLDEVTTPWVMFMSDDVVPVGARFVETLLEQLQDGDWDGIVARQVPWPDADIVTRQQLRAWTPYCERTVPMAQADHVCTLYRTERLRAQELHPVPIAEDLVWSRSLRVGLCSQAVVVHSHPRSLRYQWSRLLAEHTVRAQFALPTPIVGVRQAVASLPGAAVSGLRYGLRESAVRAAEVLAMGLGAHRGRRRGKRG